MQFYHNDESESSIQNANERLYYLRLSLTQVKKYHDKD